MLPSLSSFAPQLRLSLLPLLLLPISLPRPGHAAPARPRSKSAAQKSPAKKPAAKKPTTKKPPASKPLARPAVRPTAQPAVQAPNPVAAPAPAAVAEAAVAEAGPRTFALLVGVGKYSSPLLISDLAYPAQDAQALQDAFENPRLGGIPRERVKLLRDEEATRGGILGAVDSFRSQVRPGDRMIVFLAGHGIAKGVGLSARSWFLPHGVSGFTTPRLEESALEMRVLADKLGELPASQFALFVDACREDPTPGRGVKGNALTDVMARSIQVAPAGRAVDSVTLFACSVGQRAYEDPALKHGVFTNAILESLNDPTLPRAGGFVDAVVLARYVGVKVEDWASSLSRTQSIDIEQTPEMVAGELHEGVRVMPLKQAGSGSAGAPLPARLDVLSIPERASVFIDGQQVGVAPITKKYAAGSMPAGGLVRVRVEAPGSSVPERTIKLLPGYAQQIQFDLVGSRGTVGMAAPIPGAPSTSPLPGAPEDSLLARAKRAEERGQFSAAELAYTMLIEADARNALAHERLAQLRLRRGDFSAAIKGLAEMNGVLHDAHSMSLLSRAYSALSMRLGWREAALAQKPARGDVAVRPWQVPATSWECANYAFVAANSAVKADPASNEALVARGLAQVAGGDSRYRQAAMKDLARPVLLDEDNPDVHYAMGLAIRAQAQNLEDAPRKPEMARARLSLAHAIELRPDFYEARREMALCAALMGDREAALRECEIALSYRGGASDEDEIAALEMAMSVWHKRAAEAEADPGKKAAHEQASQGYSQDAQENARDKSLNTALQFASFVGLNRGNFQNSFVSALPPTMQRGLQQAISIKADPVGAARGKARDALRRGGLGGLGFP